MPDLGTTTATILFTDVVGSTELRSRLGETAADRVFIEHRRRLGTVIARHGGHIVKYTGDGVMASFAAASTAVHAAAAIQADVAEHGAGIVVRVGVAVGDVTREGDDYFGLPVVAAARLEAAAEGGQILVTESVRLLAGDRAGDRYEPLGQLKLKGIADPVVAYAVDWDRPPAAADGDARWARLSLPLALAGCARHPFVGRDEDVAVLRQAWDDGRQGPGRIVLIGGEAGAGKTRLASEFAHEAHGQGAWVLYGGCDDDLALPYQPWVQAADQLLTAMPKSSLEDAVTAELAPLAQLLTRAEWLAAQPSKATVDPDAARYRTYGAFAALLAEAGRNGPGLVVLDDLHWAGPQTLALLRHLARAGLPSGVLVVGTFRDTGDEVTESLSSCLADLRRVEGAIRMHLSGLDVDAVERFVAETVGHELDDDLRRIAVELTDRSGGNAFYLSELWRHLSESAGRRPRRWPLGGEPGAGNCRSRQRARRRQCPSRRLVTLRPAGHRPRRPVWPTDRPARPRAGRRPGAGRARCRGRRARGGRAARRHRRRGADPPVRALHRAGHRRGRDRRPATGPTASRPGPRDRDRLRGRPPSGARRSGAPLRRRHSHRPARQGRLLRPPGRGPGDAGGGVRRSRCPPRGRARPDDSVGRAGRGARRDGHRRAAPSVVQGEPGGVPGGVRDRHRARRRGGGGRRRGGLRDGDALPRSARRPGGGHAPPRPGHDRRRRVGRPGPGDGHARAGPGVRRALGGGVGDGGVRGRPRPGRR